LHLEERKWALIAQVVKANDGVVTSEQLAPYTGHDPKNEDGVLPVLVRFNGRPVVSDTGNILYTFPELQVTASEEHRSGLPAFLREWPYQFTNVPTESLVPVWLLSGVNFFGAWFLQLQVTHNPHLYALSGLVGIITIYGTLFIAVPAVRYLVIQTLNAKIESRNAKRQAYTNILENPSPEISQKLIEAKEQKIKLEHVDEQKIIYTTEKDALEQEFEEKGFDASP
jgi:hypothetical protein